MKKILLFFIFLLPLVHAATINDTILKSNGLNLTFNITQPITFDSITISDTSIYFDGLQTLDSDGSNKINVNITASDKYYNHSVLPYITQVSNVYTVRNWLFGTTGTVELDLTSCNVKYIQYSNGLLPTIFYHTNCDPVSLTGLSNTNKTLTVVYYEDDYVTLKGPFLYILSAFGVMAIILAAAIVMGFIYTGNVDILNIGGAVIAIAAGFGILAALVIIILQIFY